MASGLVGVGVDVLADGLVDAVVEVDRMPRPVGVVDGLVDAIQKPSGPVGGVAGDAGQKLSESRRPDMAADRVARGLSEIGDRLSEPTGSQEDCWLSMIDYRSQQARKRTVRDRYRQTEPTDNRHPDSHSSRKR